MDRIEREGRTVEAMVLLYCRGNHEGCSPCPECNELLSYALSRLGSCPHGPDKPRCDRCPVHCYDDGHRERIRAVMRYSGPRMLIHHPVMAVRHIMG